MPLAPQLPFGTRKKLDRPEVPSILRNMQLLPRLLAAVLATSTALAADADTGVAAKAVNQLGLELLSVAGKSTDNLVLAPYSIQIALAMTYAGADGKTHAEMARVLHFPKDDAVLGKSFAALAKALEEAAAKSATAGQESGGKPVAIKFHVANRLFGQQGFAFRQPFLDSVNASHGAPLELLDFKTSAEPARARINAWVAEQTANKIQDLIPPDALNVQTRLVLTNAAYLDAPWQTKFRKDRTGIFPFHVGGGAAVNVVTMSEIASFGFEEKKGFCAVTLPYLGRELQFLILLPAAVDGLADLEKSVTPALLAECAKLNESRMLLYLPKLKLAPKTLALGEALQTLGLKTAFDLPRGSADFSRMTLPSDDESLYISNVFHKAFLALDEEHTEAAAAEAVVVVTKNGHEGVPRTVKVDRPFLFAIQHRASGACLFLGRVTDPRR